MSPESSAPPPALDGDLGGGARCAPVIFLVFNRPEHTRRVLARIRTARPARIFVVCDGPRAEHPEDAARVAAVRRIIEEGVDWPCAAEHEYSEENLGCRVRVASGLTAAFARLEEAIVLEDDTLPDPSFFPYCTELLARYRDDPRIMHIGANNFTGGQQCFPASYVFSRYGHIWGWATWRRAWAQYDLSTPAWRDPAERLRIASACPLADERGYWHSIFSRCAEDPAAEDTWDYQWTFACWLHRGLSTYPAVNLIENIGIGAEATHTAHWPALALAPAREIPLPLTHPKRRAVSPAFDRLAFRSIFVPAPTLKAQMGHWVRRLLPRT